MRKETHIRLADQIASEIGLSEEATYLRKGSVVPDDWKNYPHHYGKGGSIRNYIMNSRKALLRGEKETACHHLGVAFHYLADKWTLMSGSDSRHASWERSIEKSTFIDEIDVILESASVSDEDKRGYRSLFRKLDRKPVGRDETLWLASLSRPSNWSIPSIDLNIAYTICLKIAQSVFSSVIPPPEILKQIERVGKRIETIATKFFYFSWCVGLAIIAFGLVYLSILNLGASILFWLIFFFVELSSLSKLPVGTISRFEQIKGVYSPTLTWKLAVFLIILLGFSLFFGVPWMPFFYCGLGFCIQWSLSSYLRYKSGADEVSTYVEWYIEPKDFVLFHLMRAKNS